MRRLSLATWVGSAPPQEITFSLELQHPHVLAVVRMFPPQPTVSSGITCRWMKSVVMLPPYKNKQKPIRACSASIGQIPTACPNWVTDAAVFERRHLGHRLLRPTAYPNPSSRFLPSQKLCSYLHTAAPWEGAGGSISHLNSLKSFLQEVLPAMP